MTLREARLQRRMTQEDLAAKSGVEQTTISNIETGRVQSPSWDTVAKLSAALGYQPHDIFPVDLTAVAS
jgi:transcriptional regulator with XRE-family HTH domain